ncbi:MAG: hypothetical protein KDB23_34285, partial [Planctomycetales bacterium]|nr:hypothetical protein [Planctomycetales bacterium]
RFNGQRLSLNCGTSAGGSIQVELQGADGQPLPGFALTDCQRIVGDAIDMPVTWRGSADLTSLAGKVVKLRMVLLEADLFALQFVA